MSPLRRTPITRKPAIGSRTSFAPLPASLPHRPVSLPGKRRGIPARSKKQQRLERKRAPIRNAYLRAHPLCERSTSCGEDTVCAVPSVDVHEPWSRARGGPIFDKRNMMAVCRWCHDYIHEHGIQSEAEGWLISAAKGPAWLEAGGRSSGRVT